MSHKIEFDSLLSGLNASTEKAHKKSDKALAASLQKLEEILEVVAEVKSEGKSSPKRGSLENLMVNMRSVLQSSPSGIQEAIRLVARHMLVGSPEFISETQKCLDDFLQKNDAYFTTLQTTVNKIKTTAKPDVKPVVPYDYVEETNPDSNEMNEVIANAMIYLQAFQSQVAASQADQDKRNATMAKTMINAATIAQENLVKQINDQIAAAEKAAASRPWWQKLVEAVVAVVAVAISFLTAGIGAALVAVAVTAFMDSPAFNDCVSAMAKDIGGKYGTIIAKVVMTAVIAIASCGLGTITLAQAGTEAAESAADTAVDAGVNGAASGVVNGADEVEEEVEEEVVEETVTSSVKPPKTGLSKLANRLDFSLKNGIKLGAFQFISTLAGSGLTLDVLKATSPEWMEEHEKDAMWINMGVTVASMAVVGYAGVKMLPSVGAGQSLLETVPSALKVIFPLSTLAQLSENAIEVGTSVSRAEDLYEAADATRAAAETQMEIDYENIGIRLLQENEATTDDAANNVNQSINNTESSLSRSAGQIWKEVASTIRG